MAADGRRGVGWGRLALESESLRVVVVPEMGAKIVSLLDRRNGVEWLVGPGGARLPTGSLWRQLRAARYERLGRNVPNHQRLPLSRRGANNPASPCRTMARSGHCPGR